MPAGWHLSTLSWNATPLQALSNLYKLNFTPFQRNMATRSITRSCSQMAHSSPSSAARAFLQLAPRRYFQTAPPLDFLLPSIPSTSIRRGRRTQPSVLKTQPSRTFTSSPIRRATHVVVNPKKDDDGNDMTVEITPRASNVRLFAKASATEIY